MDAQRKTINTECHITPLKFSMSSTDISSSATYPREALARARRFCVRACQAADNAARNQVRGWPVN
eukprot:468584-Pleurochrysis_carterae.AAC.1